MKEPSPPPFVRRETPKNRPSKGVVITIAAISILGFLPLVAPFLPPADIELTEISPPAITSFTPAVYNATFKFDKASGLSVREEITVNNASSLIKHGIARTIPDFMVLENNPVGEADSSNNRPVPLQVIVKEKALFQAGIKVAGLEEKAQTETPGAATTYYIGGNNLELGTEEYTFVFEYEIANTGDIFREGLPFKWRIPDFYKLYCASLEANFLFPPYVEHKHIEFLATHFRTTVYDNQERKVEEVGGITVSKIFPPNNPEKQLRDQEVVQVIVKSEQAFEPGDYVSIVVKIPKEYFL